MMLVASVREKNERIQSCSSFTKISASGTTRANDVGSECHRKERCDPMTELNDEDGRLGYDLVERVQNADPGG